jgi:protease-4
MKFLSNVLATLVGLFIFFMVLFFGLFLLGVLFSGTKETISVEKNSVIELNLSEIQNDYAGKYNYTDFDYYEVNHNGLSEVLFAIKHAKTDADIKGISILNSSSTLGMAQYKALRDAIEDFKKSKKFVVAYATTLTQKEYYLNSVADSIYLNPFGELEFKGLSSEVLFFKDLQEKSGVKMEVIRHGKYKSAVEPFLENKMSDSNKEQLLSLLNSVWNSMAADISKSRKISCAELNSIANDLLARTPEMALSRKLIDKIAYEDEYHKAIKTKLNQKSNEDYTTISVLDYSVNVATTAKKTDTKNKIAIIFAQGEIGSGEGNLNTIGEISMRRSLKEARDNKNTKAIVLRIDSPGGNALTSELIWREIELTKKIKPVVVSMGNYAASGGYYIACNASTIFAEPNTITGSIGVFGTLPNLASLSQKIGIHAEQVKTHENSADYSLFLPIDEKFKRVTQESVERIYTTFVQRVATGRKMSIEEVDKIAQGRVWSGSEALIIGLIDRIGGLDAALNHAASLAKIKQYRTQSFPEYEKNLQDLIGNLGIPFLESSQNVIRREIGEENYLILEKIKSTKSQKGIQTRIPFEINIK